MDEKKLYKIHVDVKMIGHTILSVHASSEVEAAIRFSDYLSARGGQIDIHNIMFDTYSTGTCLNRIYQEPEYNVGDVIIDKYFKEEGK